MPTPSPTPPEDPKNHNPNPEYRDALPHGPARRRGAQLNPGNRFETHRIHIDGDTLDQLHHDSLDQNAQHPSDDTSLFNGKPQPNQSEPVVQPSLEPVLEPVNVPLEIFPDHTKTIINRVAPTSDVPFDWTLNPYRGCEHGCIYCFARPYHEYLGFSSGLDFETKIVAKFDAAELLKNELAKPKWNAEPIVMSAITDVYQPIESKLQITRECLEVLAAARQPVTTMTKGSLVLRDIDLWAKLAEHNACRVTVTIVTLDDQLAKDLEPRAAAPAVRLKMIRELSKAGIPVSVNIAPVIPGLTDHEMPELLRAISQAGATRVAWVLLRLPYQLKELFLDWLQRCTPGRADKVEAFLREAHEGKLYKAGPVRRRGKGNRAAQIAQMFDIYTRKYDLNRDIRPLNHSAFKRPNVSGQYNLFND